MRQYPRGEPIEVRLDPTDRPQAFVWSGVVHRIETVEDRREPRLDWWAPTGEIHRLYYLLTTNRALICEIYLDRTNGRWFLSRTFD
jgi:hypothetical protein